MLPLLLIAAFSAAAAYAGWMNARRKERLDCDPIPLNRRRLFLLANRQHLWDYAKTTFPLLLVIWFVRWGGRISLGAAIASTVVIMGILGLTLVPVLALQADMRRAVRSHRDFNARMQNKNLYYEGGSWWYMDENWLICAGFHTACVLYAPDIDFSIGVRHEMQSWSITHGYAYIHCIVFRYKSGKNGRMMATLNEKIMDWFEAHKEGAR